MPKVMLSNDDLSTKYKGCAATHVHWSYFSPLTITLIATAGSAEFTDESGGKCEIIYDGRYTPILVGPGDFWNPTSDKHLTFAPTT